MPISQLAHFEVYALVGLCAEAFSYSSGLCRFCACVHCATPEGRALSRFGFVTSRMLGSGSVVLASPDSPSKVTLQLPCKPFRIKQAVFETPYGALNGRV